MATVNRAEFLRSLEAVQAGLAERESVDQSTCFVFKDRQVITYNEEVACRAPSGLEKTFQGAVAAKNLLKLLQNIQEPEVRIDQKGGFLVVKAKGQKVGRFAMQSSIELPVDQVEQPGEWKKLPDSFIEALSIVQACAKQEDATFIRTCIHITPKVLEAYDNYQVARYRMKTRFETPTLVQKKSIAPIAALGVHEFSETPAWVHFRNPTGLYYSCRKYEDEYPALATYLDVEGDEIELPKGLEEAVKRAQFFSSEISDADVVQIDIAPGEFRVYGRGLSDDYSETKEAKGYKGKAFSFLMSTPIMQELVQKHNKVLVGEDRLKVSGESWGYIACLTQPGSQDDDAPEIAEDEVEEPASAGDEE